MNNKRYKIVLNAPVVLGYTFLCVIVLVINMLTLGKANTLLFSVYRSPLRSLFTYFRFIGHVFGHSSVSHLINNVMLILLVGPGLEERYGSGKIALVILVTAFVTGLVHFIFFPGAALLGASGVVFAFIMLSAAIGIRDREIPLTFILVTVLYLGEQIYEGIFALDNVSHLTHIIGGVIGAVYAYMWRGKGSKRR